LPAGTATPITPAMVVQAVVRVVRSAVAALTVTPSPPVSLLRPPAVAELALVTAGAVVTGAAAPRRASLPALATHRRARCLPRRAALLPLTLGRRDFLR
jgi:hypothetical protein